MKTIFSLLLLLPAFAFGQEFRYNKVHITPQAGDNFQIGTAHLKTATGSISLEGSSLSIDERTYNLEPTDEPDVFKTDKGLVKFHYHEDQLVAVRVYRFSAIRSYVLEPQRVVSR